MHWLMLWRWKVVRMKELNLWVTPWKTGRWDINLIVCLTSWYLEWRQCYIFFFCLHFSDKFLDVISQVLWEDFLTVWKTSDFVTRYSNIHAPTPASLLIFDRSPPPLSSLLLPLKSKMAAIVSVKKMQSTSSTKLRLLCRLGTRKHWVAVQSFNINWNESSSFPCQPCESLACHNFWHWALYYIEKVRS